MIMTVMAAEALADWIDGDVRVTRAEALFMYIHSPYSLAACHSPFSLKKKYPYSSSLAHEYMSLLLGKCEHITKYDHRSPDSKFMDPALTEALPYHPL
jgi:hypothetical protein